MPIVIAPLNKELKIIKILTDDKTKKRLEDMGIIVGSNVTVLSSGGGNVVLMVKDGRVAIDESIATKILVV